METPAMPTPRLRDAGDAAFTVEYGNAIHRELLAAVRALDTAIAREHAAWASAKTRWSRCTVARAIGCT
jgi:hypothetical protein